MERPHQLQRRVTGVLGGQLLVVAGQLAVGGCQTEVLDQKLSWPESHHHLFFRSHRHHSPGNNIGHIYWAYITARRIKGWRTVQVGRSNSVEIEKNYSLPESGQYLPVRGITPFFQFFHPFPVGLFLCFLDFFFHGLLGPTKFACLACNTYMLHARYVQFHSRARHSSWKRKKKKASAYINRGHTSFLPGLVCKVQTTKKTTVCLHHYTLFSFGFLNQGQFVALLLFTQFTNNI